MKRVNAEILLVGTELLLGDIMDTNGKYLARELAALGINLFYQTVVGDNPVRLKEAIARALARSDVVIASGGLGPTADDITRESFAEVMERPLYRDEATVARLEAFFAGRGRPMTENNLRQAMVPEGAEVLTNDWGTAPGLHIPQGEKHAFLLPGPPRELEALFQARVRPLLQRLSDRVLESTTVQLYGIGESALESELRDLMEGGDPSLAPYAKDGEVLLRITSSGADAAEAKRKNAAMLRLVRERVGEYIYDVDGESLEKALVERFSREGLTVSAAESLTGGLISQRITSVSGASAVIELGVCSYSDRIKHRVLGVKEETLKDFSAVSEETAREMAVGMKALAQSDVAVSATGYAGPTGEQVGLFFVAAAYRDRVLVKRVDSHRKGCEREYVRSLAASAALALALEITGLFGAEEKPLANGADL